MGTISHCLKPIQTVCSYLQPDHLCILKLNPHNNKMTMHPVHVVAVVGIFACVVDAIAKCVMVLIVFVLD